MKGRAASRALLLIATAGTFGGSAFAHRLDPLGVKSPHASEHWRSAKRGEGLAMNDSGLHFERTSPVPRDGNAAILEEFRAAQKAASIKTYELFVARHPHHPLSRLAKRELDLLRSRSGARDIAP